MEKLRIALEIPPGKLKAETRSGRARIRLTCDGEAVTMQRVDGGHSDTLELSFDVKPGNYIATVADPETGESGTVEVLVGNGGYGNN